MTATLRPTTVGGAKFFCDVLTRHLNLNDATILHSQTIYFLSVSGLRFQCRIWGTAHYFTKKKKKKKIKKLM